MLTPLVQGNIDFVDTLGPGHYRFCWHLRSLLLPDAKCPIDMVGFLGFWPVFSSYHGTDRYKGQNIVSYLKRSKLTQTIKWRDFLHLPGYTCWCKMILLYFLISLLLIQRTCNGDTSVNKRILVNDAMMVSSEIAVLKQKVAEFENLAKGQDSTIQTLQTKVNELQTTSENQKSELQNQRLLIKSLQSAQRNQGKSRVSWETNTSCPEQQDGRTLNLVYVYGTSSHVAIHLSSLIKIHRQYGTHTVFELMNRVWCW